MAALTRSGWDLHTTKISCTPANARLSSVQSSNGALHIGNKHWQPQMLNRTADRKMCSV
jgi:hypothetical protein